MRVCLFVCLLGGDPALAQVRPQTGGVYGPQASTVVPLGAAAVESNPAAMGFDSGAHLQYQHVGDVSGVDGQLPSVVSGDAVRLQLASESGFAFGASFDHVDVVGGRRAMIQTAFGVAPSDQVGLGLSLRRHRIVDPGRLRGTSADFSLSLRPSNQWAFLLAAQDVSSLVRFGVQGFESRFVGGVAWRPRGCARCMLETVGGVEGAGALVARGRVAVALTDWGMLVAGGDWTDLSGVTRWAAYLGLRWDMPYASVQGGAYGVSHPEGGEFLDHMAEFVSVDVSSRWRVTPGQLDPEREGSRTSEDVATGVAGDYVAGDDQSPSVLLEVALSGSGGRGQVERLMYLESMRRHPGVAGVVLRPDGAGFGKAHAQEIRQWVQAMERDGKAVYCVLEVPGESEYYACAGARGVWVDPAGGVLWNGTASQSLMFGDTLGRLGVRADFVRIGDFKSAPEALARRQASAPSRLQREVLLGDVHGRLIQDVAEDRSLSAGVLHGLATTGPLTAVEAMDAGLVDDYVDGRMYSEKVQEVHGERAQVTTWVPGVSTWDWGPRPRVEVVMVDGQIEDGEGRDSPALGIHTSGSHSVVRALERAQKDPWVSAVVLRVDSPGGSALASDQIWRAVMRVRKVKPVVASMGAVAASGGYYVAAAAQEIWALPSTVTGSIGIFFGKLEMSGLAEKMGLGVETVRTTPRSDVRSGWRAFTPEERAMLADKMRVLYGLFLQRIEQGRGMARQDVAELGGGRVWSGDRAQSVGLVDRLGGFLSAVNRARELADLPMDSPVTVVPQVSNSLLGGALSGSALGLSVVGRRLLGGTGGEVRGSAEGTLVNGLRQWLQVDVHTLGAVHLMGTSMGPWALETDVPRL